MSQIVQTSSFQSQWRSNLIAPRKNWQSDEHYCWQRARMYQQRKQSVEQQQKCNINGQLTSQANQKLSWQHCVQLILIIIQQVLTIKSFIRHCKTFLVTTITTVLAVVQHRTNRRTRIILFYMHFIYFWVEYLVHHQNSVWIWLMPSMNSLPLHRNSTESISSTCIDLLSYCSIYKLQKQHTFSITC